VSTYVRTYVCTYLRMYTRTCSRAISARNINACMYTRAGHIRRSCINAGGRYRHVRRTTYLRIITYKRVILSYTPALLMIIKTPRSILFALEYFLKFSPDNGAIRVSGRAAAPRPAAPFPLPPPSCPRACPTDDPSTSGISPRVFARILADAEPRPDLHPLPPLRAGPRPTPVVLFGLARARLQTERNGRSGGGGADAGLI
jgi:hypothetical protein